MEKLHFAEDPVGSAFYAQVRKQVRELLGDEENHSGPDLWFWLKAGFWFLLCWGSYCAIFLGAVTGWLIVPVAAVVSLSGLLFGFSVGHDAAHRVLAKSLSVNRLIHFVSFLTVGVDPLLWGLRHLRSHHMYPNVEGSDIDIDKNPLLRLSPAHPWKPKHQFQHLYAPLAYAVALAHSVFWGDWIYLLSKDYAWMRRGVSSLHLYASFFGFKAVHFFLMIVLPYLMLDYSLATIVLCYLGVGALASLAFIVMLVGTHFFAEADYPVPDDRRVLRTCWAVHNLRTSCDWNPESGFARFMSGGANCHAAHHLFPTICHTHYGKLNQIIQAASAEYSITYHSKTLWQMAISHVYHLKLMGRRPQQGNDSQNRRLSPGSASKGLT